MQIWIHTHRKVKMQSFLFQIPKLSPESWQEFYGEVEGELCASGYTE